MQSFVFLDGVFAGTISPEPMAARATGSGSVVALRDGALTARFVRYAETDPRCCPSRGAVVIQYQVDHTSAGPALTAVRRIQEPPPRAPGGQDLSGACSDVHQTGLSTLVRYGSSRCAGRRCWSWPWSW